MIKSFQDKETENIFNGLGSKKFPQILSVAKRKLDMIHFAYSEQDLRVPPSNHYEHLKGNLKGYSSIRINDQYRIVFQFNEGNAENIHICDYHS